MISDHIFKALLPWSDKVVVNFDRLTGLTLWLGSSFSGILGVLARLRLESERLFCISLYALVLFVKLIKVFIKISS